VSTGGLVGSDGSQSDPVILGANLPRSLVAVRELRLFV
jgi:hypothetical protein